MTVPEMDNSDRMYETPKTFKTPETPKTAISTTTINHEMARHPYFMAEPIGIKKGDHMTRKERKRSTTNKKNSGR
jgi:hypothetical protein